MSHLRLAEITMQRQEPNALSGRAPATTILRGGIKNYLDYLEYAVEGRVLSLKVLSESVVLDAGAAKLALASRVVPTAEACAELRTARRAPLCVSLKVPRVR